MLVSYICCLGAGDINTLAFEFEGLNLERLRTMLVPEGRVICPDQSICEGDSARRKIF